MTRDGSSGSARSTVGLGRCGTRGPLASRSRCWSTHLEAPMYSVLIVSRSPVRQNPAPFRLQQQYAAHRPPDPLGTRPLTPARQMPSTSSLTSSEKALIKKHAPVATAGDKILTAAIGRVYYAYPDPARWSFSGVSGAVVYGWGSNGGWLKVVDLAVRAPPFPPVAELELMNGVGTGHERRHLAARGDGGHAVLPGPHLLPHLPRRRALT